MYTSKFNVFCITETWLSDYISDGEILPSDFVLYRKDRPSHGGGVLIAVNDSMHSSIIPSPIDLEVVSIKLGMTDFLVICCVYVPPACNDMYVSSLVKYLTGIVSSFQKCVFVGDFNFPDIDWSCLIGSCTLSNNFCEFVFDCNLIQHVTESTHISGNVLDLVLTSHDVTIDQLSINSSPGSVFSDHFIISFISVNSRSYANKSKPGYVFDFSKANFSLISDFLLESDFSIVFEYNDPGFF